MFAPHGSRRKFIALFTLLACLSNFQDSYPNSYPNTAFASFQTFINESYIARGKKEGLSEFQYSWIWSAILNIWAIGYLSGTFIAPLFTERFGRKFTLLGANTGAVIGTALAIIAVSCALPELLFVARLFSSLMSGISCSALFLFLQETTPTEFRGMTSFLSETAYLAISVFGMGMGMDSTLGKRLPFLVGVHEIAGLSAIMLISFLKETPKHLLITKNDHSSAMRSLEFYRGTSGDNEAVIESIRKEAEEGYEAPFLASIPIVLRTPHLLQALLVGLCSLQITLSIIPINYVSTMVLEAHFSAKMAQIGSFVFIACNFLASIFGAFAVEHFGRRPMLLTFGFLNTSFLFTYCVFDRLAHFVHEQFKYGCVISLIAYGITFGGALGPIAFFITTELVPQQFRSAVQSMAFTTNTAINFILSFVTIPLYKTIDVWGFIPLFIAPSYTAWLYLLYKLPETKGREIHEIVRSLAGKNRFDSDQTDQSYSVTASSDISSNGCPTTGISPNEGPTTRDGDGNGNIVTGADEAPR